MNRKSIIIILTSFLCFISSRNLGPSWREERDFKDLHRIRSERMPDPLLESAIVECFYIPEDNRDKVRYYYNYVDLNGDDEKEIIVLLGGICGSGGCDLLIFQREGERFRLNSIIALTYAPIIVSPHQTNGWNDLIVKVKGDVVIGPSGPAINTTRNVLLRFDGSAYPSNPTILPTYNGEILGTAYLADEDNYLGIRFSRVK